MSNLDQQAALIYLCGDPAFVKKGECNLAIYGEGVTFYLKEKESWLPFDMVESLCLENREDAYKRMDALSISKLEHIRLNQRRSKVIYQRFFCIVTSQYTIMLTAPESLLTRMYQAMLQAWSAYQNAPLEEPAVVNEDPFVEEILPQEVTPPTFKEIAIENKESMHDIRAQIETPKRGHVQNSMFAKPKSEENVMNQHYFQVPLDTADEMEEASIDALSIDPFVDETAPSEEPIVLEHKDSNSTRDYFLNFLEQTNSDEAEPSPIIEEVKETKVEPPVAKGSSVHSISMYDPFEQIIKFKELLDLNIITQEEFNRKKKELLDL